MFLRAGLALPQIWSGRVRAVAVTGTEPSPDLPDVRMLAEDGIEFTVRHSWSSLFVASGTLRVWCSGSKDYATLIHPALEAAVQEKRSAAAAPAQAARSLQEDRAAVSIR